MSCCGRKSPADALKKVQAGPLVYDTDQPPKQGRCAKCNQKGASQVTNSDGAQVRIWICRRGHVSPRSK